MPKEATLGVTTGGAGANGDPQQSGRWFTMADAYDRMCAVLVPCYDLLQDEMLRVAAPCDRPLAMADLGAGSGIFIEKALDRCPGSTAYWVDYSSDFLRVAKRRLARFGERVHFILTPLEEPWDRAIGASLDAVVSMSAIHHLTTNEKPDLYARCYGLLRPGGWLLNADEMTGPDHAAYVRSLHRWVEHVEEARQRVPAEDMPYCEQWCAHFEGWKQRNIGALERPKAKGDDIHESYVLQLEWLREIGFVEVDLLAKFHIWCLIVGRKP